jgi:hypothetical protein
MHFVLFRGMRSLNLRELCNTQLLLHTNHFLANLHLSHLCTRKHPDTDLCMELKVVSLPVCFVVYGVSNIDLPSSRVLGTYVGIFGVAL